MRPAWCSRRRGARAGSRARRRKESPPAPPPPAPRPPPPPHVVPAVGEEGRGEARRAHQPRVALVEEPRVEAFSVGGLLAVEGQGAHGDVPHPPLLAPPQP